MNTGRPAQRRLIDAADLALSVGLPVCAVVAALAPYRTHALLSRCAARILPASFRRLADAPHLEHALSIPLAQARGVGRDARAAEARGAVSLDARMAR